MKKRERDEQINFKLNSMTDIERFKEEAREFIRSKIRIEVPQYRIDNAISEAMKGFNVFDLVIAGRQPEIFCEKCGECCRRSNPIILLDEDVVRFGEIFDENFDKYVKFKEEKAYLKQTKPCVFLRGNKCSIYPNRPFVCRQFPIVPDNKDGLHLGIFPYCSFIKNMIKQKALIFLISDEHKRREPEEFAEIEKIIKKVVGENTSFEQQLERFAKLITDWELK